LSTDPKRRVQSSHDGESLPTFLIEATDFPG